jgi:hypothetical protein
MEPMTYLLGSGCFCLGVGDVLLLSLLAVGSRNTGAAWLAVGIAVFKGVVLLVLWADMNPDQELIGENAVLFLVAVWLIAAVAPVGSLVWVLYARKRRPPEHPNSTAGVDRSPEGATGNNQG